MGLHISGTVLYHLFHLPVLPLATTIYYSFFEYFRSGLKIIGPNFVGLKNYAAMIREVPKYFSNTMIMWLMGFIPQIIVSLVAGQRGLPICG